MGDFANFINNLSISIPVFEDNIDNVKVSIIIPAYNSEKFIVKCLDSIIKQTLEEIEIICIDDGSTDNTKSLIAVFAEKDKRIKLLSQKNCGQSVARNYGIKEAKGEYIGFVDSDDWVDNDYFEKLYETAKKFDCDIAAGNFYRQGKIFKSVKVNYVNTEVLYETDLKIQKAFIPKYNYVWNKIYRRKALLKTNILFPEGMYFEDICWLVKIIYYLNGFVTVPNTFYYYRRNKNSTVMQKSVKHKRDFSVAVQEFNRFIKENNINILLSYKIRKKDKIKLLGLQILKIEYYYPATIKYKLFGFITLIEIEKFNLENSLT